MAGVVELKLAGLYGEGAAKAPPKPGEDGHLRPHHVREMEEVVRGAMRSSRVSFADGREELRLLGLCREALGAGEGIRSVPVTIAEEQFRIRPKISPSGEKQRKKKARRANRKPKKRRKR